MANLSKTSMTEAGEDAPAPVCYFVDVLPTEIRLPVYELAFQGSRVHAALSLVEEPSGDRHPLRFRHSMHSCLLFSCRKIYDEALVTFWSETVLSLVEPFGSMWADEELLWGDKLARDDYSYNLCRSLPDVAKRNIKHIRNMVLPPLNGEFVQENPQLTAAALLSNFKSLATCEISPTLSRAIWGYQKIKSYSKNDTESYCKINTKTEVNIDVGGSPIEPSIIFGRFEIAEPPWVAVTAVKNPECFLSSWLNIDAAARIVFLWKTKDTVVLGPNLWYVGLGGGPTGTQFWNLSRGVFCAFYPNKVDDEYGYKMAMRPESEFPKTEAP